VRNFLIVWGGQLVSVVGTGLTGFSLGFWVYQQTHSVTRFTLIYVMTSLPGVLLAPVAGALVDRWDRRRILLACDATAALVTAGFAVLLAAGSLRLWEIYLGVGVQSAAGVFQWLAYSAAITLWVPKRHFARADAMRQFGIAAAQILSPLLAGYLVTVIHIWGVLGIDFASYMVALLTLALARAPEALAAPPARRTLRQQIGEGWAFVRARPGLMAMLWLFAGMNLLLGLAMVLLTPLVLSSLSARSLGGALAAASSGLLAGSLLVSAWGGPRRRVQAILALTPVLGLGLSAAGLRPALPWIGGGMFCMLAGAAVVNSASQALWQCKVPPALSGRVFALRRMLAQSTVPLSYLLAGPLADRVFEPAMAPGGRLAPLLGPLLGTGRGRGIGLMFVLMGVLFAGSTAWGFFYRPLRHLEEQLPDAVAAAGEAPSAAPAADTAASAAAPRADMAPSPAAPAAPETVAKAGQAPPETVAT
jgi:DHA3 family macrolide efflux protein-like MFS transporter